MNERVDHEKNLYIQYGAAASEAMFDFPCLFFHHPDCKGVIAYRKEFNCAIVVGDPICPPEEINLLTKSFQEYCQKSNLNILYVIVSKSFNQWALSNQCKISIEVCEELIFNPMQDPKLASHRLKHRVEKAQKQGLILCEYNPYDEKIEKEFIELGVKWQQSIKGPNIYLGHLNFFENYQGKRWFYVKDKDQITAMTMLSRIESKAGWLLKFLIIDPSAISGTSEFLITSVLDQLRKEKCHFLTKGMLPADQLGHIEGLGYLSQSLAKLIYQMISKWFKFKNRKEYWLRYHPKMNPAYLVFYQKKIGLNEIRALQKVFRTNYTAEK